MATKATDVADNRPPIPTEFMCPITHTIMVNAVMDDEGNSYSEAAIKEWLEKCPSNPLTRKPLSAEKLVPNRMLRNLIEDFLKKNNMTAEQVPVSIKSLQVNHKSNIAVTLTRAEGNRVLVKLVPTTSKSPLPLNLVCAIDISASMTQQVTLKNENGDVENLGLSVLDLVKHSIKTIILCLSKKDTISFVTYNQSAAVKLPPTLLTDENKKKATSILEGIRASGQTNLWDGLVTSLQICESDLNNQNNNVMLFTDGMPNVIPPRGHIPMLEKYISDNKGIPAVVSTFGFGYAMDSTLLTKIAEIGGGTYAFIPDGSLVGTIFVNAVSTMMSRYVRDVKINIEESKQKIVSADGINASYPTVRTASGVEISVGNIAYDQPRHIIIKFSELPDDVDIMKAEDVSFFNLSLLKRSNASVVNIDNELVYELEAHELRLATVDVLNAILNGLSDTNAALIRLQQVIKNSNVSSLESIKDLLKDITGQITEATQPAAFQKWGRHFLPSLKHAHAHQICNNFKDPGVQHYGGELFEKLRDIADGVFIKMPAMVASTPARGGYNSSYSKQIAPKAVSAAKFYNCNGGCVTGDSSIVTPNGLSAASELSKGSIVSTPSGDAEVICVVKLIPENGKIPLVKLPSGLRITPFHPVLLSNGWSYPINCEGGIEIISHEEVVFDFVLSNGHVIIVDSIPIVTLGHYLNDDVVRHEFFGTDNVIEDLKQFPNWESGEVILRSENYKRNSEGLVCGIKSC